MTTFHEQTKAARRPALDRDTAMRLASTEYTRFHRMLQRLTPDDWARPTDCTGWDVRALAGHVLGMAEMAASMRANLHQSRAAKKRGGLMIDALTAVQVEEQAQLSCDELVSRFGLVGPKAARGRRRAPGFIRRRAMSDAQQVGDQAETWTFGYLLDVILTRDPWMHRIDASRATGRPMELTADHDGVIVADIVDEWARRHGEPFALELSGPAGGTWGEAGEPLVVDAVDFCRALSGRASLAATRAVEVPF